MTELMDAVDALTKPTHVTVGQWYESGCLFCEKRAQHMHTTRIQHAPLLDQLRDAVTDAMNPGKGSSGSPAFQRNLIDVDAMRQFMIIASQIRDWCRMVGATPSGDATRDLRAWYAATLAQSVAESWYIAKLRQWEGVILARLDPPVTIELTSACPACGADTWTDDDGVTLPHPLQITYRRDDPDILGTARGLCRACRKVWRRTTELRALRWSVDQNEQDAESATATGSA